MSENDVNWSHLPHSPELFFACGNDFTRRDLKKAYHRFIKQFKPEKFPEEFKKIRKAFEELDARLSYGHKPFIAPIEIEDFVENDNTSNPERTFVEQVSTKETSYQPTSFFEPEVSENTQEKLKDIVENGGKTEALLEYLEGNSTKTGSDKILYGLIKEQVDDNFLLLNYLLDLYLEDPNNYQFKSFLFHLLRSESILQNCEEVIELISKTAKSEDFFYFAEGLIYKLADEKGVEDCALRLEELEKSIGYIPERSLITFYTRFCFRYAPDLKESFFEEKINMIENATDLYYDQDYEMFFLNLLFKYQQSLKDFLNGCPTREKLHYIINRWCKSKEAEKHRNFINDIISLDLNTLIKLNKFTDPSLAPCSILFSNMCLEIKESDLFEEDEKQGRIRDFLYNLDIKSQQKSFRKFSDRRYEYLKDFENIIVGLLSLVIYLSVGPFLPTELKQSYWRFGVLALIGLTLSGVYKFLIQKRINHKLAIITKTILRRTYKVHWRMDILKFLKQNSLDYSDLYEELIEMTQIFESTYLDDICECLGEDHNLSIFSSIYSLQI